MTRTCKQVRQEFIDFFVQRGHTFVPSSSLLPADDPTLLFANAGMNQFKDIFLGREKRPYVRAANSQKCIRAGGKHNDLEDVGHDTYHHTFFEMLGNWSFGDYFKKEAIDWAWELLTKVWGLDPKRLHTTYFEGDASEGLAPDDEARELWLKYLPAERIHPGNKKDNFWEMGETGPCGPCSEIHYDFTPDFSGGPLVNAGDPRVIEIWNLVFMQFNRAAGGLSPLPAKHVDTGMGLERVCRILQGVDSNYGIDIFRGIFDATQKLSKTGPYTGKLDDLKDIAYRVVADHARALTFAIADGIIPSNEGRGYVVRRILRRAARYGRQYLGIEGPFITKLVPTVVALMGESFPEIAARQKYVQDTILTEEEAFGKTLDRGIELFERQAARLKQSGAKQVPGDLVFDLYATYGFPVDLTQIMAAEQGITVDVAGYEAAMAKHREVSAGAGDAFKVTAVVGLPATDDSAKYNMQYGAASPVVPVQAKVLGWVVENQYVTHGELAAGVEAAVVLDRTNFYGEQGGQVGDSGVLEISTPKQIEAKRRSVGTTLGGGTEGGTEGKDSSGARFIVRDTHVAGQCVLHVGALQSGVLKVGQTVTAVVDSTRLDTMRNHTGTHVLNWALREVLGQHINQAGSVVAPDRLRFDFTHNHAVKPEELARVETLANQLIQADEPVTATIMPLADGKKIPGLRAVFGEKYPDPVRVISVGGHDTGDRHLAEKTGEEPVPTEGPVPVSAEFCGGTHLSRTGQIGLLKIVAEESVAKGVRRITAITGRAAVEYVQQQERALREAAGVLRCSPEELPARLAAVQKEIKELRKRPGGGAAGGGGAEQVAVLETSAGKVVVMKAETGEQDALRALCDQQRQKGFAAIFVGGVTEDKVTLVAMLDDALAKGGKLRAGDWVKAVAPVVEGSGGGKPTLAQAGGKKPGALMDALHAAAAFAKDKLA